jgi:hypothetical protein
VSTFDGGLNDPHMQKTSRGLGRFILSKTGSWNSSGVLGSDVEGIDS